MVMTLVDVARTGTKVGADWSGTDEEAEKPRPASREPKSKGALAEAGRAWSDKEASRARQELKEAMEADRSPSPMEHRLNADRTPDPMRYRLNPDHPPESDGIPT